MVAAGNTVWTEYDICTCRPIWQLRCTWAWATGGTGGFGNAISRHWARFNTPHCVAVCQSVIAVLSSHSSVPSSSTRRIVGGRSRLWRLATLTCATIVWTAAQLQLTTYSCDSFLPRDLLYIYRARAYNDAAVTAYSQRSFCVVTIFMNSSISSNATNNTTKFWFVK